MEEQIKCYENKLSYEMDSSDLWQAIENKEAIIVIDTRKKLAFENEHIPNSINIPHKEMNKESTSYLDKSKTYICYCDGIGCNASTKGALKMAKLNFKVKELIGGIFWWKQDGYITEGEKANKETTIKCNC